MPRSSVLSVSVPAARRPRTFVAYDSHSPTSLAEIPIYPSWLTADMRTPPASTGRERTPHRQDALAREVGRLAGAPKLPRDLLQNLHQLLGAVERDHVV